MGCLRRGFDDQQVVRMTNSSSSSSKSASSSSRPSRPLTKTSHLVFLLCLLLLGFVILVVYRVKHCLSHLRREGSLFLFNIVTNVVTIIITRPKPAYGRQGLAGSWGQDTDQAGTFLGVLNHENRPETLKNYKNRPETMKFKKKT